MNLLCYCCIKSVAASVCVWLRRNEAEGGGGETLILEPPIAARQVKRVSLLGSIYRESAHLRWG